MKMDAVLAAQTQHSNILPETFNPSNLGVYINVQEYKFSFLERSKSKRVESQ
jgi:hypothetical protein